MPVTTMSDCGAASGAIAASGACCAGFVTGASAVCATAALACATARIEPVTSTVRVRQKSGSGSTCMQRILPGPPDVPG